MENTPLKNFGFSYAHNGRNFALTIVAPTAEEAQACLGSMTSARLVGEMKAEETSPS